ncbi:Alpha/Beta hydrolase protein [Amanita rubescens]|nr:Alpha/Beta hydrolase protein [Amanita rubescens]
MSALICRQPIKSIYWLLELPVTAFVLAPLWALLSISPSWRPRRSWTIKRVMWVNLIRRLWVAELRTGPFVKEPDYLSITTNRGIRSLESGHDTHGVWVPAAQHLVTGELKAWAEVAGVSSVRIPGYWTHKIGISLQLAAAPQKGEKVVYHLHGGSYILQSANPLDPTAAIGKGLLKYSEEVLRVFSIEYRRSSHKPFEIASPFPAALLDALAGYSYLISTVGFSPSDIVLVGDSAGGNLALALIRYLIEHQESPDIQLPVPPGHLVLLSPWADMSKSHETPSSSTTRNWKSDYIRLADYARTAFLGPHKQEYLETNCYISPASLQATQVNFKKFPRTFIVAGGAEIMYDQIVTLKDRMIKDLGEDDGKAGEGKVRFYDAPDAVHDYLTFHWHEPERMQTLKAISEWLTLVD